ncbi:MAG: TIGR03768 family metallophosphoesterase [Candidatus Saganbacteria bacterium]|nr:TIGR03768 family metallophosphoesterase [Candidatus Saganbacteria bacterium]
MELNIKKSILPVLCLSIFILAGCGLLNQQSQNTVYTTVQRTVVPDATPSTPINLTDFSSYDAYGYGKWSFGPGLPYDQRLDLMPATFDAAALNKKTELLSFFTISDVHIADKEAPNQLIYWSQLHKTNSLAIALCSGSLMYSTQFLDTAVQTINDLHRQDPFNFGLCLGDAVNSSSYIETRWFIDILDGNLISPSSGAHLGSDTVDYQENFQATGLCKDIPWYQVVGNHDHFWGGSLPNAPDYQTSYTAGEVLKTKDFLNPSDSTYYYWGVFDGMDPVGRIIDAGPASSFSTPPTVEADPNRRSLSLTDWMHEFSSTTSSPAGHGFNLAGSAPGCYSFVPKPGLPLKVIVLDDTDPDDSDYTYLHVHGYLDHARWIWLKQQLADGDSAGQLMIIAAHVPIGVEPASSSTGWSARSDVTLEDLVAELQSHPNLIMWLAGHRHLNTVKAFISPDPNHPEYGFWEVETTSLKDFPQQLRTFKIDLNQDNSISIFATDVDPAVQDGSLAAKSRKYMIGAVQIYGSDLWSRITQSTNPTSDPTIKEMPNGSYNAELVKQLTPPMEAILRRP